MKKMIIMGALALFSLTSLTAMAQSNAQSQNNSGNCCGTPVTCVNAEGQQVQCYGNATQTDGQQRHGGKKGKKDKKGRKDRNGATASKGQKQKKGNRQAALFEGITLTAEQQTKLTALQTSQREGAEKQRTEAQKQRTEAREKYQKELSKILTPEQYAAYQANLVKIGSRVQGQKGRKFRTNGATAKNARLNPAVQGQVSNFAAGPAPQLVK